MARDDVTSDPLRHADLLTIEGGFRQTPKSDGEQPTMPKPRLAGKRRRNLPTVVSANLTGRWVEYGSIAREARIPGMDDRVIPARSKETFARRSGEPQVAISCLGRPFASADRAPSARLPSADKRQASAASVQGPQFGQPARCSPNSYPGVTSGNGIRDAGPSQTPPARACWLRRQTAAAATDGASR